MSGWNTDFTQLVHGMLRRLGFQFAGGSDVGHQRKVHIENVVASHVVGDLPDGFQNGVVN